MNYAENQKPEGPEVKKEFTIIVNARVKEWTENIISFQQLIVLAFGIYQQNNSTAYSVSYKKGEDANPEGTMVMGDVIHIKDKMIFNVSATDKS